jgi:sulfatase maturation enzyme AslB (radical SAM superfamily)
MTSKCSAFWHHINIRNDNRIFPCCRFKTPLEKKFNGNIEEVIFSEEYQLLREKSLNSEFIEGCEKCYYEEKNNKKSLRQKFNEEYTTDEVSLEFLEIGFDNICNLTCDGCWDEFSSAWSIKNNPTLQKKLHFKSIDEITIVPTTIKKVLFLGGEPLMTNRHDRFLNLIEFPNNVELIYNTNGTFLLDQTLITKLKSFKQVTFILSIDGYKELNEKVRSGSKWEDIINFINQINQLDFKLEVNSVIHLNNWHGFIDLEKFIESLNVKWTVNLLTYPKNLDVNNAHNKDEIIKLLNSSNIPNKEFILNHII